MSDHSHPPRRPLEAVIYSEDGRPLARCLVHRGRYVIGHEPKNEIVVNEPSVSSRHARLSVQSDDEVFIEDLESANGTFVNGAPVEGETRIYFDSQVRLGGVELRFERTRLPAAIFDELPSTFLRPQRYELGEVVVQGRTSTIYRAHDHALGREVAMKVMLPERQHEAREVLRFLREALITGQIPHAGVLPIYDLGVDRAGHLFFTTRFIEGESLGAILTRLAGGDARTLERHPLPALLQIWRRACDAVAFAHARGVVHNALTAEAVEVSRYGEVFVTQWALALVQPEFGQPGNVRAPEPTAAPPLTGSSAPEQAAGLHHEIDTRTDVFALGALLYRILLLREPLEGDSENALLEAALNASVIPPKSAPPCPHWPRGKLPEHPAAIALKALSYAREDRHPSVAELQREVAAWQENGGAGERGNLWEQITGRRT